MKLNKLLISCLTATLVSSVLFASENGTSWGYTGVNGPDNWGDLPTDYSMCKKGKSQSPIDITPEVTVESDGLKTIEFNYSSGTSFVENNGHTVQVDFNKGNSIVIDGTEYSLLKLHFHTPSENHINGKSFPLEGHFVYSDEKGSLAVVALLFEDGGENQFIKKVWSKMPDKVNIKNPIQISAEDVNRLLPKNKDYYRFHGSLTTPPCTEGVIWLVLKNYATISKTQVQEFLKIMKHKNNRPIQPINGRKVMK